jgi:hypothetical protein
LHLPLLLNNYVPPKPEAFCPGEIIAGVVEDNGLLRVLYQKDWNDIAQDASGKWFTLGEFPHAGQDAFIIAKDGYDFTYMEGHRLDLRGVSPPTMPVWFSQTPVPVENLQAVDVFGETVDISGGKIGTIETYLGETVHGRMVTDFRYCNTTFSFTVDPPLGSQSLPPAEPLREHIISSLSEDVVGGDVTYSSFASEDISPMLSSGILAIGSMYMIGARAKVLVNQGRFAANFYNSVAKEEGLLKTAGRMLRDALDATVGAYVPQGLINKVAGAYRSRPAVQPASI